MSAAASWDRRGNAAWAEFERRCAKLEREAAELQAERAAVERLRAAWRDRADDVLRAEIERRSAESTRRAAQLAVDEAELQQERSRLLDQRELALEAREHAVVTRERVGDERDRIASGREQLADERERLADEREDEADQRERVEVHRRIAERLRARLFARAASVRLDLPGHKSDQINLRLENDVLTVEADRKLVEKNGETYHRSERAFGKATRSFTSDRENLESGAPEADPVAEPPAQENWPPR